MLAQAATLAYLDVLIVLAIFTACMVPLVLMLKRAKLLRWPRHGALTREADAVPR